MMRRILYLMSMVQLCLAITRQQITGHVYDVQSSDGKSKLVLIDPIFGKPTTVGTIPLTWKDAKLILPSADLAFLLVDYTDVYDIDLFNAAISNPRKVDLSPVCADAPSYKLQQRHNWILWCGAFIYSGDLVFNHTHRGYFNPHTIGRAHFELSMSMKINSSTGRVIPGNGIDVFVRGYVAESHILMHIGIILNVDWEIGHQELIQHPTNHTWYVMINYRELYRLDLSVPRVIGEPVRLNATHVCPSQQWTVSRGYGNSYGDSYNLNCDDGGTAYGKFVYDNPSKFGYFEATEFWPPTDSISLMKWIGGVTIVICAYACILVLGNCVCSKIKFE
jgi:hypothetical protein